MQPLTMRIIRCASNPATKDQDWYNSPKGNSATKHDDDYHLPLTKSYWNALDIAMDTNAKDISVIFNGFSAAPNCHFQLLNVNKHVAMYNDDGLGPRGVEGQRKGIDFGVLRFPRTHFDPATDP